MTKYIITTQTVLTERYTVEAESPEMAKRALGAYIEGVPEEDAGIVGYEQDFSDEKFAGNVEL